MMSISEWLSLGTVLATGLTAAAAWVTVAVSLRGRTAPRWSFEVTTGNEDEDPLEFMEPEVRIDNIGDGAARGVVVEGRGGVATAWNLDRTRHVKAGGSIRAGFVEIAPSAWRDAEMRIGWLKHPGRSGRMKYTPWYRLGDIDHRDD